MTIKSPSKDSLPRYRADNWAHQALLKIGEAEEITTNRQSGLSAENIFREVEAMLSAERERLHHPLTSDTQTAFVSGQWHAFDRLLNFLNTLENRSILKKDLYAFVMDMRPESLEEYMKRKVETQQ